jgi:hypothetical protein
LANSILVAKQTNLVNGIGFRHGVQPLDAYEVFCLIRVVGGGLVVVSVLEHVEHLPFALCLPVAVLMRYAPDT